MSKFNVGDKVECIEGGHKGCGWYLRREYIIKEVNSYEEKQGLYWFTEIDAGGVYGDSLKLVSPKKELIKKDMEIDEIKKIDKSVLAKANAEVLEEIADEQKATAKTKLRELYDRKKVADEKSQEVSKELKEITKDLKVLTTK